MGTWGENFLENDSALDLVSIWEEFVLPYTNSASWDGAKIWRFFDRVYFSDGMNYQESDQNAELFAIGLLYQKHNLELVPELKNVLELAVNAELRGDVLDEWPNSKERKKVLTKFLKEIGGIRKKVSDQEPENPNLAQEIDGLIPFANQIDRWAKVVSPPHSDKDFERLYPALLDSFERILAKGFKIRLYRSEMENRLVQLRFMILAFYVGWKVGFSPEEIVALVKKAEATEGSFFMALAIGGANG